MKRILFVQHISIERKNAAWRTVGFTRLFKQASANAVRFVSIVLLASQILPGLSKAQEPHRTLEEVREFDILVQGKPAGASVVRITDRADGTTRVETEAHVKVSYLVYVYRYEFHGQETWRGKRLLSADNRATDDGKKFEARAKVGNRGGVIEAQGRTITAPAIDMTTNYWQAPDLTGTKTLSFMNADRGTIHTVTVERLGQEPLSVGGRRLECTHYRVSGDAEAELWFDGRNRIVRQTSVEDGYPTELRLTRIQSNQVRRQ
ncbi:MAG TPA: DUF6134 family protein [Pirellulales bacterium]|nr:DUF6134 family protein [Pirellulales bacterium]